MVGRAHKSYSYLLLLILICCLTGSLIGEIIKPYLPVVLSQSFKIGIGPFPLDLKFMCITLGFSLNMNIMSILGLIVALVIYLKN